MIKCYGILAAGGIISLVKIENGSKAYVFHLKKKKFVRDNYYLAAECNPGADYWDITEEEAMELIKELSAKKDSEEKE